MNEDVAVTCVEPHDAARLSINAVGGLQRNGTLSTIDGVEVDVGISKRAVGHDIVHDSNGGCRTIIREEIELLDLLGRVEGQAVGIDEERLTQTASQAASPISTGPDRPSVFVPPHTHACRPPAHKHDVEDDDSKVQVCERLPAAPDMQ